MYKTIERFLYSPSYSVLISIYPFLQLYATNLGQVGYRTVMGLVLIALACGLGIYIILLQICKNKATAGLVTSILLISILYYGHMINAIQSIGLNVPAQFSFLGWSFFTVVLIYLSFNLKAIDIRQNSPILNLIVIILLLFPIIKIGRYLVANTIEFRPKTDHSRILHASIKPDIYYIILDSYGRSDILKDDYGYDNSEFIQALESLGFYVAQCSQSNYHNTMLSLGSSLNMEYLPALSDEFGPNKTDSFYLFKALDNNSVRRSLELSGYKTIAFETGFPWAEPSHTDLFFSPKYETPVDEFSILAIKTTLFRILDDLSIVDLDTLRAERYRARSNLALSSFTELATTPGPKFVFMHLILPHPPYVFDAQGNPTRPDSVSDEEGYPAQTAFVSAEILKGIETLLAQSSNAPVIILQGDHGPFGAEVPKRHQVLNAYYFPGHSNDIFYPSISPVNTFRLVFNEYFDENHPILEDLSYVSDLSAGYDFRLVPNTCPADQ